MKHRNNQTGIRNAYEMNLEGWARALEYRDHETEGHSRRVVELCIQLACAMGYTIMEIVHIRRGALLHDSARSPYQMPYCSSRDKLGAQ